MRTLLLTVLLLVSPALAQTEVPAPATPAAPTTPPAPAPTPTPTPTPAPILRLSAPVGASAEFNVATTSKTSMTNVQVSALPGSKVPQATLDKIRKDLTSSAGQFGQTLNIAGKAFFRVASRDDAGRAALVATIIQSLPGQKKPGTMKIAQTVAPGGQVSGMSISSDDPVLGAALSKFTPEKLQELADQNGANFTGVYGQPLTVGQSTSATMTMDTQDMLSSVLGAIASQDNAQALFGQVQSTPLSVTTTTTYQGLNAAGAHEFKQVTGYSPFKATIPAKGNMPAITVELLKVDASGTLSYRKDGLPGASSQHVKQQMQVTIVQDGVQIRMTLVQEQAVTMTGK